jgi:hypothetical protein
VTQLAIWMDLRGPESPFLRPYLVLKTDIMHIVVLDKGKLAERRGRKSTGLRDIVLGQRGYRNEN